MGKVKKAKSKTVQVTITVPKSLKVRMDRFKSNRRVNWSNIACKAFDKHLVANTNDFLF